MIIREGTTHPGHRRIVLLFITAVTLVAALVVSVQGKALYGAVVGYETTTRITETKQFQSGCNECLDNYVACTSPLRTYSDLSPESIATINGECVRDYQNCHETVQCFN